MIKLGAKYGLHHKFHTQLFEVWSDIKIKNIINENLNAT